MRDPSLRSPRSNRFLLAALAAGLLCVVVVPSWAQVMEEDRKLLASDGTMNDWFGYSIAIDNGVIAVGASGELTRLDRPGSVYLFRASTGEQLRKLVPSDGADGDLFGASIAIADGVVAVGAYGDDDNGDRSGSAYLFDASTGEQLFKLVPTDGAAGDEFGVSIASANGIVAVGARGDNESATDSGSAYLFDASTGEQLSKLLASDGEFYDLFGCSIAISNGVVGVGAIGDDDNGTRAGAAYLFDASTGEQLFKLLPSDGAEEEQFGNAIAISPRFVAVGTRFDNDNGEDSGSAYVFDTSTGAQIAKLLPSDGAEDDEFGTSIAIARGVVAVGAFYDNDSGENSGSAYLFDASTGTQLVALTPSDGASPDWFGQSVTIGDEFVAVGAIGDDDNGFRSGSAYVFDVDPLCPVDLNRDGLANTLDFLAFLNAWRAAAPVADWDVNDTINTLDFLAYLNDWRAGC